MSTNESIPFHVDIQRIVQLLANQIYQSPLALLRENCQNAYDAVLIRQHIEGDFDPKIEIQISNNEISVEDNGIGMSRSEVKKNYWRAGSSGKNNENARAAGVVGTFGIGAMANFGIADEMEVLTEKVGGEERIESSAQKAKLSATEDCINIRGFERSGNPGTKVTAKSSSGFNLNVPQAIEYVRSFVQHVDAPVFVNGNCVSQVSFEKVVPPPQDPIFTHEHTGVIQGTLQGRLTMKASATEVWIHLTDVIFGGGAISGELYLKQNQVHIRGFRSKFALATSTTSSFYKFGGVADFSILAPTAGREALTTQSVQTLQQFVTSIEEFISLKLGALEISNGNQGFVSWAASHNRFDLCRNLVIRVEPNNQRLTLGSLQSLPNLPSTRFYIGSDQRVIKQSSSEETPLVVVSRDGNRRKCEVSYLQNYCKVAQLDQSPKVVETLKFLSPAQNAIQFQLVSILKKDYFVESNVEFGILSQDNLPFLINANSNPIQIVLVETGSVATLVQLYNTSYESFSSFMKDFVRSTIFPQISSRVPSSTRQGAEAFLKLIQKPREQFSIDTSVHGDLSEIWQRVNEGAMSAEEAAVKSREVVRRSIQVVDRSESVRNILPDVIDNQANLSSTDNGQFDPMPAITRPKTESDKMLLTIAPGEQAINGFRTFLAITKRVRDDRGDFFLQPHTTQIVWAGQKVIYIFQHHSKEFSLYYEVLAKEIVSNQPGGSEYQTTTIAIQNQTYIPVPNEISSKFDPSTGSKEFYSRSDLLYPEVADI